MGASKDVELGSVDFVENETLEPTELPQASAPNSGESATESASDIVSPRSSKASSTEAGPCTINNTASLEQLSINEDVSMQSPSKEIADVHSAKAADVAAGGAVLRRLAWCGRRAACAHCVPAGVGALERQPAPGRAVPWLAHFHAAAAAMFITKSVAMMTFDMAAVVLPHTGIAQIGASLKFAVMTFGCIVGAGPAVAMLGSKRAMSLGMLGLNVYFWLFTSCAAMEPSTLQWCLFLSGNFLAGAGAALGYTAISVYMAKVAVLLAEDNGETTGEVTRRLGGSIGVWALGSEVVIKLLVAGLEKAELPDWTILALWSGVATVLAVAFNVFVRDVPASEDVRSGAPEADNAEDVNYGFFSLWSDLKLWLLAFPIFSSSLTGAVLINIVNPDYVVPMLGKSSVCVLLAIVSITGVVLAKPYSFLSGKAGNGLVMAICSASFALVPALVLFSPVCTSGGWWVVLVYISFGSARAVVEGTCRAVVAEYFPGPKLDAAYANATFQEGIVFAIIDLAITMLSQGLLMKAALACAVAIVPFYVLASALRSREGRKSASTKAEALGCAV